MGRKNKNKKSSSSGQGTSSQDVSKPLSKEAKKEVGELIKSILESRLDIVYFRSMALDVYVFFFSQSKHIDMFSYLSIKNIIVLVLIRSTRLSLKSENYLFECPLTNPVSDRSASIFLSPVIITTVQSARHSYLSHFAVTVCPGDCPRCLA